MTTIELDLKHNQQFLFGKHLREQRQVLRNEKHNCAATPFKLLISNFLILFHFLQFQIRIGKSIFRLAVWPGPVLFSFLYGCGNRLTVAFKKAWTKTNNIYLVKEIGFTCDVLPPEVWMKLIEGWTFDIYSRRN